MPLAQVELSGLLPPWVVNRICQVAAVAQGGAFKAVLDTLPTSSCLNVPPPADSAADADDDGGGVIVYDDRYAGSAA